MKMIRTAAMAIAMAGCSAAAHATTFDFSYSVFPFMGNSPLTIASGTLDADQQFGNTYSVMSVTGTRGSSVIDGFDYFDYGQSFDLVSNGYLSNVDIEYSIGDVIYEATYHTPSDSNGSEITTTADGLSSSRFISAFSITPHIASAVPEPATWAMMIGGFGLLGVAMRRRQARQTPIFA